MYNSPGQSVLQAEFHSLHLSIYDHLATDACIESFLPSHRLLHRQAGRSVSERGAYRMTDAQETGFFRGLGGSWDTPYGAFFLSWYSGALLAHGERLIRLATSIFNTLQPRRCTLSNHINSAQSIVNVGPAYGSPGGLQARHCCRLFSQAYAPNTRQADGACASSPPVHACSCSAAALSTLMDIVAISLELDVNSGWREDPSR